MTLFSVRCMSSLVESVPQQRQEQHSVECVQRVFVLRCPTAQRRYRFVVPLQLQFVDQKSLRLGIGIHVSLCGLNAAVPGKSLNIA